jgi:hypothetical protein
MAMAIWWRTTYSPGKPLWHTRIGDVTNAPQTYMLDGHQYLIAATGDTLWSFCSIDDAAQGACVLDLGNSNDTFRPFTATGTPSFCPASALRPSDPAAFRQTAGRAYLDLQRLHLAQ